MTDTATKSRYQDIRERLEKATVPDYALDCEIHIALTGGANTWNRMAPQYMKSLDATIALIERVLPDEWQYIVESATRQWYLDRPSTIWELIRRILSALFHALEVKEKQG